jgi:hypothetical protein
MQFYGGIDDGKTNLSIMLSDTYLNGQYEPFVSKAAAMAYLILDQRFVHVHVPVCVMLSCACCFTGTKKKPEVCLPYIEVSVRISENLLSSSIKTRPMGGFV